MPKSVQKTENKGQQIPCCPVPGCMRFVSQEGELCLQHTKEAHKALKIPFKPQPKEE